jgi:hypothetical protein
MEPGMALWNLDLGECRHLFFILRLFDNVVSTAKAGLR